MVLIIIYALIAFNVGFISGSLWQHICTDKSSEINNALKSKDWSVW